MIAAICVLVSHAWPISLGQGSSEPLKLSLGMSLGTYSVYVFFSISGFLVARSFEQSASIDRWILARAFRLFPALAIVLLISTIALGPMVTDLSLSAYFTNPETWAYLPRNLTLAFRQHDLPGVFASNVFPSSINGSLWTLFFEVSWYGAVLGLGLFGLLKSGPKFALVLVAFLATYVALLFFADRADLPHRLRHILGFGLPFMIGMAFYVFRDRLVLHPVGVLVLVLVCAALADAKFVVMLQALTLSYGVFVAAFLISGPIRLYNRLGDYSYGVYLYAFPVQQTVVHPFGAGSPLENILISAPITLGLAVLSWIFVEKPALGVLKNPRLLGAGLPGLRRRNADPEAARPSRP